VVLCGPVTDEADCCPGSKGQPTVQEFPAQLSNYHFVKNDCAVWRQTICTRVGQRRNAYKVEQKTAIWRRDGNTETGGKQ
jgi:hypothetical protein